MSGSRYQLQAREVGLLGRDATRRFRSLPHFDELMSSGRVVLRKLPDGGDLLCCESFGISRAETLNAEEREVVVIASDGSENRYGDIDDPLGWDDTHYRKNPVILMDHWYGMEAILGINKRSWVEGVGEQARLMDHHKFDPPEMNAAAKMVFNKVLAGSARTVSTSFIPLRVEKRLNTKGEWTGAYHYREMERLETSWVAVPANRNATILDDAPEAIAAGVSEEVEDLLVRTVAREIISRIG